MLVKNGIILNAIIVSDKSGLLVGYFEEIPGAVVQAKTQEELEKKLFPVANKVLRLRRQKNEKLLKGRTYTKKVFNLFVESGGYRAPPQK